MKINDPLGFRFISIFLRSKCKKDGVTHCHGFIGSQVHGFTHAVHSFSFLKKMKRHLKGNITSFAVEKSLDRKFGSVTDQYIFRLHFIDGNFRVSVRSDFVIA